MQTYNYAVSLQDLPDEFIARFRDLPEVLTGATDRDEALALAADALEEAILARLANDEVVPWPSEMRAGEEAVSLRPRTAARAAFDHVRRRHGLSKLAAARRIGKDEKVVRRILDGAGNVRLESVLDALAALGVRATIALPDEEATSAAPPLVRAHAPA